MKFLLKCHDTWPCSFEFHHFDRSIGEAYDDDQTLLYFHKSEGQTDRPTDREVNNYTHSHRSLEVEKNSKRNTKTRLKRIFFFPKYGWQLQVAQAQGRAKWATQGLTLKLFKQKKKEVLRWKQMFL